MKQERGSFVVMFKPGIVTGLHNENEIKLKDICEKLGGFDCKIFDPYMVYAGLADEGLLVRLEQVNAYGYTAVAFFYPDRNKEHSIRRKIINKMLDECSDDPKLFSHGYAILSITMVTSALKS